MRLSIGRPMRWNSVLVGLAAVCWLGQLGCAGSPSGKRLIQGSRHIAVAPMNLAVRLPPALEDAVEPVQAELIRYLQSRDGRVALIWPPDAWGLWRESVAAVSRSGPEERHFQEASSFFARELTDHADFQLLVMPSLVVRGARVRGRTAQWDGVRRRITTRLLPMARAGLPDPGTEAGDAHWEGEIPALSLHVLVFRPDGEKVYEGWGGIALTHAAMLSSVQRYGDRSLVLAPAFFENRELIREGIGVALDPYSGGPAP